MRDALEAMPPVTVTGGVIDYTGSDHRGYQDDSAVVMKIVNGDWKLKPRARPPSSPPELAP